MTKRTRGGWIPTGTAAERRVNHSERGTDRGRETRRVIIDAARRVFERQGYLEANVDDIVREANVARGTFYTYFPAKLDVFRIVAAEVGDRVRESVTPVPGEPPVDPVTALDRANRRYIATYRENAAIYGIVEQVATIDPEIREQRHGAHQDAARRVSATIERWQRRGVADAAVDPVPTAVALVSMTSNLCYWSFVGGDDFDEEQLATTITGIWVRTVGLRTQPLGRRRETLDNA